MINPRVEKLSIDGCWVFRPQVFSDERGSFFEWFQNSTFKDISIDKFSLAQANCSVSNKGVIRGIHFAKVPPGQAKYVTCFSGSVFDVVVDLRKNSPTFGKWESVVLEAKNPAAICIPSGIGHAFMALEDHSVFAYLCDQRYNPNNEFDISPFDESLNITWPNEILPILSNKDKAGSKFTDLMEHYPNL